MPSRDPFDTTRWSLVIAAGGSDTTVRREALNTLFQAYWFPLYSYIRRRGYDADAANDLLQSFLLSLLERGDLRKLSPDRGRFRAFLLAALRNFLENQRVHDSAQKRGGGVTTISYDTALAEERFLADPTASGTPETAFDRTWALAMLEATFGRIRLEWEAKGRAREFDLIKSGLVGDLPPDGYGGLAEQLGTTEAAAKMSAQRLKARFGHELRRAIGETVAPSEIDEELRYLLKVLQA
jgi:RNA polymerase sigma-70 factor (ECF subfamily)